MTRRRSHVLVSALVVVLVAACNARHETVVQLPEAPPWWAAGIPMSHLALTKVLAPDPDAPPTGLPLAPARPGVRLKESQRQALRSYLAVLARGGPGTNPELFPTDNDRLAYLVNAHVGWALLLNSEPSLLAARSEGIRTTPFPLGAATSTLERLESEILQRWSTEPRIALMLNPGWRGGPPLPRSALEAHAVSWQIAEHATLCGREPGFWKLDSKARTLTVSAFTAFMPGLPPEPARRARRLLDAVPPPAELAARALETCGDALQRCTIVLAPLDEARL